MLVKITPKFVALFFSLFFFASFAISAKILPTEVNGFVMIKGSRTMEQTVDSLKRAIKEKGLILFTAIDHSENAQKAGLELPSTTVVVFGNPNLGTPLMQAQRTIAIDLPQKMLVWQDAQGQVWIGYNDPVYLAKRHGISSQDEIFQKIAKALQNLAQTAAGKD